MALPTGTLVNRLTTSKLTMTSVSTSAIWWIHGMKSAEFLTCEGPWPASGERILATSFASMCDGDPMAVMIGLRGSLPCVSWVGHRSVVGMRTGGRGTTVV